MSASTSPSAAPALSTTGSGPVSKSTTVIVIAVIAFVLVLLISLVLYHRRNDLFRKGRYRNLSRPVDTERNPQPETTQVSRGRRYNRRQDSGASIKSIPLYTQNPSDSELVLIKPHIAHDESTDVVQIYPPDSQDSDSLSRITSNLSSLSTPVLANESTSTINDLSQQDLPPPTYIYRTSTSSRSSLDIPPSSDLVGSSSRRTSDASLLLPQSHIVKEGSHRKTFFRPRGPSVSSLSHLVAGNSSGKISTDRRASSASLLDISEPLRDTLVRSSDSYVYPKAGLSAQQVAFLSSRDNLATSNVYSHNASVSNLEITETRSRSNSASSAVEQPVPALNSASNPPTGSDSSYVESDISPPTESEEEGFETASETEDRDITITIPTRRNANETDI